MSDGPNDNQRRPGPPGRGPGRFGEGGPPGRYPRSWLVWATFIGLGVVLLMMLGRLPEQPQEITIDRFYRELTDGNIKSVQMGADGELTGEFRHREGQDRSAPGKFTCAYPPDAYKTLLEAVTKQGEAVKVTYDRNDNWIMKVLLNVLPWLVVFAVCWFLVFRLLRGAGAGGGMLGNFGRSRHRVTTKEHTNITFADVAGVEDAKQEVQEIVTFLKNPKKFQRLGGRVPRGVLLVGSPGTGKTLLAKAIAGEADVPFFSISGSDFVEMFVGVGASRVRDLFKQAKENSPCIIFLDEIDAVGRRRVNDPHGGSQETAQTLNAILVEMDGFDTSDQVIVIAATNRADVLDPALTRPGRFDRQIQVPLPDIEGRLAILKVHARKVKLATDVDLHRLARGTPMFSGADLAAIINEAAIGAAMANKDFVEQEDLEEARDKVRWGRARKGRTIDEREREITAYHEAGHALASCLLPESEPLHKVSIIPRGPALGATFQLPEKDRHIYTRRKIMAEIQVALAGRIAERMFCDDLSSGAAEDIRRATEYARVMVCDWGMSKDLGPVHYAQGPEERGWVPGGKEYSEQTAQTIDQEIRAIVSEASEQIEKLLGDSRDKLQAVAKALLKYETLSADDVHALIRGEQLTRPTVGELLLAEQNRRAIPVAEPLDEPPPARGDLGRGPLPQPG